MTALYNKKNKEQLVAQLKQETFNRITMSFYRYVNINNPVELRDAVASYEFEGELLNRHRCL